MGHPKSTLKPHPVMNKLQSHMAAVGYRQKQPVAATSNRLEHFVTPNHLYGAYIQFGQAPNHLQSAKTKFISQLASHPSFDAQLKGLLHAGVGGGYQQTFAHIKNLQKMNYMQQQNKLQSFYNHIPADVDLPKKLLSSAEKDPSKYVTPSTPLFPHIPPSVLTPFFQQVQQQQQNKYGFSLKTQHPAPPAASPAPTMHVFKEKPQKLHSQPTLQYDSHQVHPTSLHNSFKENHVDSFGFTSYQGHQQPPIDHKPHEAVKFKDTKPHSVFNEIRDEYSKNLVPPPPSTQQAFLPTIINPPDASKDPIEILNKYNINPHSPLQDANRFSYDPYARPSVSSHTPSSTPSSISFSSTPFPSSSTTARQPFYSHTITFSGDHNSFNSPSLVTPSNDNWIGHDKFITTEKPNVFKNLFRTTESEYKQHKLMHPSYTGQLPNKRPSPTTPITFFDSSTEEPLITHSFFTIEDAISDPTLIPPGNRNKYKYTTEAEENHLDEPQPEIVTIGPSFVESQELGTTTAYPMFKSKGRRRRPKPQQSSTESSVDTDSTENPRNRFRQRTRPTTESDSEVKTTLAPPTQAYQAEESSLRKHRKKLPTTSFNRNRLPSGSNRDEDQDRVNADQQEPSVTQVPSTVNTVTIGSTVGSSLFTDVNQLLNSGNGLRSRFRPTTSGDRITEPKPTRSKTKFSDDLDDPFRSSEVTRDSENTRVNFKLANIKPSLRLPSSSFSFSTSSTSASFTSEENSSETNKTRPELNRPRFSIKEYRNKLNRTTTSTTQASSSISDVEITTLPATKLRFPTRNRFVLNTRLTNKTTDSNEILSSGPSSTTDRPVTASESTTTRTSFRPTGTRSYNNRFTVKKATTEAPLGGPQTPANTSRIVNRGRIRLQDTTTQSTPNRTAIPVTLNSSTLANRRPSKISLRQRIQNYNRKKDSENSLKDTDPESNNLLASSDEAKTIDDLAMIGAIDTQSRYDDITTAASSSPSSSSTTTEIYRHVPETAIMKISPKDSSASSSSNSFSDGDWDLNSASSDYSKRVVELTLSASKDKGFKSVNKGLLSRRVPGYFTLATEDPILPIEAFFPQVKKVGGA